MKFAWILVFGESAAYRDTQGERKTERQVNLVGLNGLEPSTSRLSGVRSNHLSYKPTAVSSYGVPEKL